ncbi:lytic transglycosylase domain-containing protein [Notoacmeibacter sp. MSK16QG-6]|uniref:lytic transglycosylase domain-containing protein n=1 Tax=Notoacmeibacter sp. MSK16QG-6 TaxID=2957982 RepID=UPI00209E9DDE|nr:lytic transglycosylase domain-containing protein [Notoacmeibacter sp. MSK16QG-6]MCP1201100.1 lytic transglycosylase domain-containing protein [Notoacmeibacter sp. MSK16QG-6]
MMSAPVWAQIPVIDDAVLEERQKRDQTTTDIEDVNKKQYVASKSVTCSMYKPGRKDDPVAAVEANPEIAGLIKRVAREEGVNETQFMALVYQESRFNPCAKSPAGAMGLSQLMPATAKELGVDPNNIEDNLRGGARYYKQQLRRFDGDVNKALAAYNAGAGNVNKYGGIPPFKETQGYVRNITKKWIPMLGGSDQSALPMDFGGGTSNFASARESTLNAKAANQAIGESTANVQSWYQQLGEVESPTIQDSWDLNSAARNSNLEMFNQVIMLGTTLADLINSRNAMTLGEESGTSRSTTYRDDDDENRETTGLCDGREDLEWDEEEEACVEKRPDPENVELLLEAQ